MGVNDVSLSASDLGEASSGLAKVAAEFADELGRRQRRVDPDGEVIQNDLNHVIANTGGIVGVVRERLRISQQQILPVRVFQGDPVLQRANVVAEMQGASRSVAS
jgi:hypothetical protein